MYTYQIQLYKRHSNVWANGPMDKNTINIV